MLLLILLLRRSQRRLRAANRETWSQWWVSRRETHGTFAYLVQELSCEDMENVRQFHRLDRHSCEEVVALVAPLIEKDTRLRCSVKPSERLSVKVDSHKLRYDAARYDAARYDAARYDAARYDAARYDAARYDAARYDAARYDAARYDAARYDAARYDAVRQDLAKTHCCCSHMQRLPL